MNPKFSIGEIIKYKGKIYKITDIENYPHDYLYKVDCLVNDFPEVPVCSGIGRVAEDEMTLVTDSSLAATKIQLQMSTFLEYIRNSKINVNLCIVDEMWVCDAMNNENRGNTDTFVFTSKQHNTPHAALLEIYDRLVAESKLKPLTSNEFTYIEITRFNGCNDCPKRAFYDTDDDYTHDRCEELNRYIKVYKSSGAEDYRNDKGVLNNCPFLKQSTIIEEHGNRE